MGDKSKRKTVIAQSSWYTDRLLSGDCPVKHALFFALTVPA